MLHIQYSGSDGRSETEEWAYNDTFETCGSPELHLCRNRERGLLCGELFNSNVNKESDEQNSKGAVRRC